MTIFWKPFEEERSNVEQISDLERTISDLKQKLSDLTIERESQEKLREQDSETEKIDINEVQRLQSALNTVLSDGKTEFVSVHAVSEVYKLYKTKSDELEKLQESLAVKNDPQNIVTTIEENEQKVSLDIW